MKPLSELIEQYNNCPTEALKNEIISRIVKLPDLSGLDHMEAQVLDAEWIIYDDNVRVKLVGTRKYLVADVFGIPTGGYMCYAYELDLEQYSDDEILGYKSNCKEYSDKITDEDSFAAFAIAKAHDASETNSPFYAATSIDLQKWYEHL